MSKDLTPPYPHLYHLGIASICFVSRDLDADVKVLKDHGVQFVSEPVRLSPPGAESTRFVCFKDPDGTILELAQTTRLKFDAGHARQGIGVQDTPHIAEISVGSTSARSTFELWLSFLICRLGTSIPIGPSEW